MFLDIDDEITIESKSDGSDSDKDNDDGGARRRKLYEDNGLDALKILKLKIAYYGPRTYYGRHFGCLMFFMVHALHKSTNELLWLACISLTNQFVHERVTNERY